MRDAVEWDGMTSRQASEVFDVPLETVRYWLKYRGRIAATERWIEREDDED